MEELNKKLAEWAGFSLVPRFGGTDMAKTLWQDPAGEHGDWLPNFTQSLDACFEWLVPIAIDKISTRDKCNSDLAYIRLFMSWLNESKNSLVNALALCKAIEKLIDGGT